MAQRVTSSPHMVEMLSWFLRQRERLSTRRLLLSGTRKNSIVALYRMQGRLVFVLHFLCLVRHPALRPSRPLPPSLQTTWTFSTNGTRPSHRMRVCQSLLPRWPRQNRLTLRTTRHPSPPTHRRQLRWPRDRCHPPDCVPRHAPQVRLALYVVLHL